MAIGAQVAAGTLLQFAFHDGSDDSEPLLKGLQTDEQQSPFTWQTCEPTPVSERALIHRWLLAVVLVQEDVSGAYMESR